MEGSVWLLASDTTQGPSVMGWAALKKTQNTDFLWLLDKRSFYVQCSWLKAVLLLPDSLAFSRTGLSTAETPPRGPELCLLRQSKSAKERGRKSLVPELSQVPASWQAGPGDTGKSPRLREAGLYDYRPGAPCPQW